MQGVFNPNILRYHPPNSAEGLHFSAFHWFSYCPWGFQCSPGMCGVRGSGETNVQGVLLNDMRGRCNLNAVSLGSIAVGHCYTYASGDQKTTVDYIFADEEAISMLSQCRTLPFEDLNMSDHLTLFADMMYVPTLEEEIHHVLPRVDWMKAVSSGDIENYRQKVAKCLNRLDNNSYDCVEEVDRELYYVSKLLCDSAVRSLPLLQHRKKLRWRDSTLTALCAKSRIARKVWREAGSPSNGPLYDEKCHLRRAVRKRVRFCAAQAENRRIQRRDRLFSSGDKGRFRLPQRKKKVHTKLLIDGEIIEGTQSLLDAWSQRFEDLAKSRKDELPQLQSLESHVKHLTTLSLGNEDSLLDVPFSTDEVSTTMKKIKRGKAPGPDNLMAEHLLEAGEAVVKWLANIFNAIVSLEAIPDSLKCGTTVPVYKGGGRDPLRPDSYRGITLSSVVSKGLEMLLLNRLETVFVEADIPTRDEIGAAVSRLKKGKSGSVYNLLPEHLIYGGSFILNIFLVLFSLENLPQFTKARENTLLNVIVIGITMMSVIMKAFEYAVLERILPTLKNAGHPLRNQMAYQKSISYQDAIFSTQEIIFRILHEGGHPILSLYDLEKVYDSIEHPILFKCLFEAGLNWKSW